MASHKFKVGENVMFKPTYMSTALGLHECKIIRQLPVEQGSYLYRIKCGSEHVERVAREGELAWRRSINTSARAS